jgi:hypothetical protein
MARQPSLVTIAQQRHPFRCSVCQGALFQDREIKLNTTGAEFLNLAWANRSATGLVCMQCGYVHTFMSDAIELWQPDGGYPPPRVD